MTLVAQGDTAPAGQLGLQPREAGCSRPGLPGAHEIVDSSFLFLRSFAKGDFIYFPILLY